MLSTINNTINPADPFDPRMVQVMLAMQENPPTLIDKLRVIWALSSRMIRQAEKNHPNIINKIWGNNVEKVLSSDSLILRSHIAEINKIDPLKIKNFLASAYFGILKEVAKIQNQINLINQTKNPNDPQKIRENNDALFIDKILIQEKIKCNQFIDQIVPLFFPMQLYCYHLVRILESPFDVLADPLQRRKVAYTGSSANNYGEHILKSMISDFLASQIPDPKHSSINALFNYFYLDFEKILNEYQDRLDSPTTKNGKALKYAKQLKPHGMLRKLQIWKNDPLFRVHLERICIIRSKIK